MVVECLIPFQTFKWVVVACSFRSLCPCRPEPSHRSSCHWSATCRFWPQLRRGSSGSQKRGRRSAAIGQVCTPTQHKPYFIFYFPSTMNGKIEYKIALVVTPGKHFHW